MLIEYKIKQLRNILPIWVPDVCVHAVSWYIEKEKKKTNQESENLVNAHIYSEYMFAVLESPFFWGFQGWGDSNLLFSNFQDVTELHSLCITLCMPSQPPPMTSYFGLNNLHIFQFSKSSRKFYLCYEWHDGWLESTKFTYKTIFLPFCRLLLSSTTIAAFSMLYEWSNISYHHN